MKEIYKKYFTELPENYKPVELTAKSLRKCIGKNAIIRAKTYEFKGVIHDVKYRTLYIDKGYTTLNVNKIDVCAVKNE